MGPSAAFVSLDDSDFFLKAYLKLSSGIMNRSLSSFFEYPFGTGRSLAWGSTSPANDDLLVFPN